MFRCGGEARRGGREGVTCRCEVPRAMARRRVPRAQHAAETSEFEPERVFRGHPAPLNSDRVAQIGASPRGALVVGGSARQGVLVPCAVAVATQSHRGELNTSQRRTPPAHRLGAIAFLRLTWGIHENSTRAIHRRFLDFPRKSDRRRDHASTTFARAPRSDCTTTQVGAPQRIASQHIASHSAFLPRRPPFPSLTDRGGYRNPHSRSHRTQPTQSAQLHQPRRACLRSASLSPQ